MTFESDMNQTLSAPAFPKRITIEISSLCNLACVMCPRKFVSGKAGIMDEGLFRKIIEEIQEENVDAVVPFFRGESLLHPGFTDLLVLLREKCKARIQLATNGLLLNERMIRDLLLEIQIDFISFSLDALTEKTYRKIRIGGDYDRVMENVHGFLRKRADLPSCRTVVQVSATENSTNREEIPAFIEYWKERVDRVRIYPRHSDGGKFGSLATPESRRPDTSRGPCAKPFTDFVIYADGHVALCNHDWNRGGRERIGSVREKSLGEIWNGLTYMSIRNRHLNREWDEIKPCAHCDHWQAGEGESSIGFLVERS